MPLQSMPEVIWEIAFVLPNLRLDPDAEDPWDPQIDLGLDEVAIASPRDERVKAFITRFPQAGPLLASFRDEQGKQIEPAVLIVREDFFERTGRQSTPLVSFRNAAAIAYLLLGRARAINDNAWSVAVWSDSFDFHPASIDRAGSLTVITPAVLSSSLEANHYNATPSPGIPEVGPRLFCDGYLVRALGGEWRRRFRSRRGDDSFSRVLFRSLELAYMASATPLKNQASLYDLGILIGLWISALEILAHPGPGEKVRQTDVLKLVAGYEWDHKVLREPRYKIRIGKNLRLGGTAIQRATNHLYAARNRFLHGEPVNQDLLQPVLGKRRVALLRVVPLVYRAALEGYLLPRYPRSRTFSDAPDSAFELFWREEYEKALLRLMGYAARGKRKR